jgi:hypothetical protein
MPQLFMGSPARSCLIIITTRPSAPTQGIDPPPGSVSIAGVSDHSWADLPEGVTLILYALLSLQKA